MKKINTALQLSFFLLLLNSYKILAQNNLIVTGIDTISGLETYDNVTVEAAGVLIVDSILNVNFVMKIKNGGIVTHLNRQLNGLKLIVSDSLIIETGGKIDVSGKGLSAGEAFDQNGNIVAGVNYSAGGSYGGSGGTWTPTCNCTISDGKTNQIYGIIEDPNLLGAGGGSWSCGTGGRGGGRIAINSTNIIINGTISASGARGGQATCCCPSTTTGGGSGGSIKINASSVSGAGIISASGGNGGPSGLGNGNGGGGGGGRIAVFYESMNLPNNNIVAFGGIPEQFLGEKQRGAAGTIYLKKSGELGGLIVDNNNLKSTNKTILLSNLSAFKYLKVDRHGRLYAENSSSSYIISDNITASDNAVVFLGSGTAVDVTNSANYGVTILSGANVILDTSLVFHSNKILVSGGILDSKIDLTYLSSNDFQLSQNGTVNLLNESTFSIPEFNASNFQSGTVNLTKNADLSIASNSIEVAVNLIKDGKFGQTDFLNSVVIMSGGVLSHSQRYLDGLTLNADAITVQAGGKIDVSGKGLSAGEAFDQNGSIVAGVNYSAGGSYGGTGGTWTPFSYNYIVDGKTNPTYGFIEQPDFLGTGGGSWSCGAGGRGGGRISINCTNIVNNGTISASGAVGGQATCCCPSTTTGGGSGGSIKINSNSISGTGIISASGGNGGGNGGGGGGGRIAVFYESINLPLNNIVAFGGIPASFSGEKQRGAAGTIYLKDIVQNQVQLKVDNNNQQSPFFASYNTQILEPDPDIILSRRGKLAFEDGMDVSVPELTLNDGLGIWIKENSILHVENNKVKIGLSSIIIKDGKFGLSNNIDSIIVESGGTISSSAFLTFKADYFEIKTGGLLDVTAKGLKGGNNSSQFGIFGETYTDNLQNLFQGSPNATGASYGGLGEDNGNGQPNKIYGKKYFPDLYGSGGGGWGSGEAGGNGGGKINLVLQKFIVNGIIRANGGAAPAHSGGGSGGSILLFSNEISGNGIIEAKGGTGGCSNCVGASGGGGRIAIYTHNPNFPAANISVAPGAPNFGSPQPGTIVYLNCNYETNAAVDSILYPVGNIMPLDTTIQPMVVVQNLSPSTQTFPVQFKIGNFYEDITYVNLASGQRDTITFAAFKAEQVGTWPATATIQITNDDCLEGNQKSVNVPIATGDSPAIAAISPNSGGNTGATTIKITGQNFREGINARIEQPGGSFIMAHHVEFVSGTQIFASVNLQGAVLGMYDVVVQNPDFLTATYANGFEVTQGSIGWEGFAQPGCLAGNFDPGQLLEVELIYPERVRQGRVFPVSVRFSNKGNIDIPVPTRVLVVEIDGADPNPNVDKIGYIGYNSSTINSDQFTELTLELAEEGGPPGILRAGATGVITLYAISNTPLTGSYPTHFIKFRTQ